MKIELDIYGSGEMVAFGKFMADLAVVRAAEEAVNKDSFGLGTLVKGAWGVDQVKEALATLAGAESAAQAPATAEPAVPPKTPRGKGKAAEAKPTAETAPPNTDAVAGGEAASSSTAAATDEPPAITHQEVRDQIIDLLNDWSAAAPDQPTIRTDVLGPLLKPLDAEKIGGITPDKYASVPGLVDESRVKLKAYVEARAVGE